MGISTTRTLLVTFLCIILEIPSIAAAEKEPQHITYSNHDYSARLIVMSEGYWDIAKDRAPVFYTWKPNYQYRPIILPEVTHLIWGREASSADVEGFDFKKALALGADDCTGVAVVQTARADRFPINISPHVDTQLWTSVYQKVYLFCSERAKTWRQYGIQFKGKTTKLLHYRGTWFKEFEQIEGMLWKISNRNRPHTPPDHCASVSEYGDCVPAVSEVN